MVTYDPTLFMWQSGYWRQEAARLSEEIELLTEQRGDLGDKQELLDYCLYKASEIEVEEAERPTWTHSQWLEALECARADFIGMQLFPDVDEETRKVLLIEQEDKVAFYQHQVNIRAIHALYGVTL